MEAYNSYTYEISPDGVFEFGGSYEFLDINVITNIDSLIEEKYSRWPKTISGVFYINTGLYPNAANYISGNSQNLYLFSTGFNANDLSLLDPSDYISYPVGKTVAFNASGMSFYWSVSGIEEPTWGDSRMILLI